MLVAPPLGLGRGRSSVMARPCPALHCRMRSAWRGAGKPRLAGLCTAAGLLGTLAHLALEPLLLLGAVPLVMQRGLHSLGDPRTIGWTQSGTSARALPVLTTAALLLSGAYA